jgi:hypothetical protein
MATNRRALSFLVATIVGSYAVAALATGILSALLAVLVLAEYDTSSTDFWSHISTFCHLASVAAALIARQAAIPFIPAILILMHMNRRDLLAYAIAGALVSIAAVMLSRHHGILGILMSSESSLIVAGGVAGGAYWASFSLLSRLNNNAA